MRYLFVILLVLVVFGASCREQQPKSLTSQPNMAELPPPGEPVVGRKPPMPDPIDVPMVNDYKVEVYASGLAIPWDIAFVSKDRAYVTERSGKIRLIENGKLREQAYATIDVHAGGEGGLMGIAPHPDYPNPRYVYIMYTYSKNGQPYNRISRFTDTGTGLTDETRVVSEIPGGLVHDGGIIRFGPDGMLYAGTGDARNPELAQDKSSLAGKILRITPEGKPPMDNPFPGSLVYAYGFRNVQGLAWNPANGELWATNHGPTGEFGLNAKDSVFIVKKGGNHGWPRSLGVTDIEGVVSPVLFFPDVSEPPGSAVFYDSNLMPGLKGNFLYASLAGEHLTRVVITEPRKIDRMERWWQTGVHKGNYGRLRAVVQGPDGTLYISTSNRDGRGNVRAGDDKILRISPK